ncbi:outer membrane protein [Paracoccus sanguinis]|uniref:outer membrane protein n=1 Tax=Paracoccus sanguinis TaxID=1545044 RepID=UPI001451910C|nr:porin family protein [Paracoccus sanguinis]QJD16669.1 porin family protein [Paracoccus sanguinis]
MRHALPLVTGFALLATGAAQAGGFAAPVVEVEPIVAVTPAPAPAWQGGYAGVALGYAFNGDDRIGRRGAGLDDSIGTAELSGVNLSLRAGYRWQRDNWVVGPELSYTAGDIKDGFDFGAGGSFESKVNNLFAVKLKTGYLARPDTLVYGIAGWQTGDFTYNYNGADIDYDADGYVLGLGAEKMITDRISVTGEYEYSNFGKTTVDLGGGVISKATPEHSNVKLGLNFKF